MHSNDNKTIEYALITGATGGLGKAFCHLLSSMGYGLIVTGRSEEKLQALQEEISTNYPQTQLFAFVADLTDGNQREALMRFVDGQNIRLSMLVNVAGADIQKGVTEYTEDKLAFQCRINFEAAVSLCRYAIQQKADKLEIINISSVSGIYPMPYFAVYSATKAALTSFSLSLREEMKGKKVSVTAILPGAMPTREDIKAQIKGQGAWGKLAAKSPEAVARVSIKAVRKNKGKVIVGFWNKVMRISTAWLPRSWRMRFIAKRWSKISKDAF